ncbi:MAG TPA: HTH domain-containing protein, partial [Gemmataceae bacterium]|nr:HTH domain-containing protein [Gemmataceae bacterium]
MAKKQSPKPQGKAAKQRKGRKPAEAPEVHVPAATEPPVPPESPVAIETPPEAAAPPLPEQPTAEPPAPASTPAEVTTSVEVAPEAAAPEAPAPEAPAPEAAAPAQTKAKKVAKEPKPKKTSALDAAAKVLAESGEAMTTQAMIEAMAAKGYWSSPGGQTPSATLYSAILRELATKGEQARFVKTDRGKFGLR